MTPRQRETLAAIHEAVTVNGYSPSLREVGDAIGVSSTNRVSELVHALRGQGVVEWELGRARTLRLTEAGYAALCGEG